MIDSVFKVYDGAARLSTAVPAQSIKTGMITTA